MYELNPVPSPLGAYPSDAPGVYWSVSSVFIEELAAHLRGHRVLEVFSGNGYLAAWLGKHGVDVRPTTRFSGHDAHERGLYADVEELDCESAVTLYGADSDILLMSWPTVTPAALRAALLWGAKPIVFVGEASDRSLGLLGGCASDDFFERMVVSKQFSSYTGRRGEIAVECRITPPEKI